MSLRKSEMFKDYTHLKVLGEGSFGKCYLVERKSDKLQLVLKANSQNNLSEEEKMEIVNEAKVLQHADHPNIIKFYDFFEELHQGKLCIVTEYCDDGDVQ